MDRRCLAFGIATRTGSAFVVALTGSATTPGFAGRREVDLVPDELPAQPYHAAADLDLEAAERLVAQVEQAAETAAIAALRSAAGGELVVGVAVVVKPVSVPSHVAGILRSHAWMHAAEGALYRKAMLAAANACGWTTRAVEESALPSPDDHVAALGKVAGRPWRRSEKDATRAALTLLPEMTA